MECPAPVRFGCIINVKIGASIIASYATASITSSSHAEGGEGGPANWQIDEDCIVKFLK